MKYSIVVPAYNSEKTIKKCLDALVNQNFNEKYEIVVVDDGSKDKTKNIVCEYSDVKYVYQSNAGPAAARNTGWRNCIGDIVVFTDSDCVPEKNWLKEMVKPFINKNIAAVGGCYDGVVNSKSRLANIIGEEIKYRYSKMNSEIDAHGSYSLAIRKNILESTNGYDEKYPVATAEDFDLCYRIVAKGNVIILNKNAKLGHHHPEILWKYLKTQFRHGYYRVKLYKDNPKKVSGDKYSGNAKYQVILSGLSILSLLISFRITLVTIFVLFLFQTSFIKYLIIRKENFKFIFESILLQILRGYAWFFGMFFGIINLIVKK
ncbi:MAG TPA: glycosyltransferase [Candidatus Woesebacteria bacterium]|nr:glycosyltransferase [Candidatus Woesebacteria bacterium]